MKDNRFFFGIVLLVLGVLFLIDQLNLFTGFDISVWRVISIVWPLILVYLGSKLLAERKTTGGIILVGLGLMFLSSNIFDINAFSMLWPLIIIGVALSLLVNPGKSEFNATTSSVVETDSINEDVVFWGMDRTVQTDSFKGGKVTCVFGGGRLDLSNVKIAKDGAVLEVNCIFGGLELIVPEGANIITNGTGVFGGWAPRIKSKKSEGPVLEIKGAAVFGGVDIKDVIEY